MTRSAWLILLPGLVMLCLGFLWHWVSRTQPEPEMVQALLARKYVPAGTHLSEPERFFARDMYPKDALPPGAVTDMDRLRDKVVWKGIREGEPLLAVQLLEAGPLVDVLPANARACTVRVEMDPETVEQAQPTAKVDLICWKRLPDGQLEYTMIAENTEVSLSVRSTRRPRYR